MKRVEVRSQAAYITCRILTVTAAALALIILAGTVYGLVRRSIQARAAENPAPYSDADGEAIFSGLGTIRAATADSEPETVIISVAFPYDKSDRPFSEELASRLSWFKSATAEYLGTFTAEELTAMDEAEISAGLLTRYNSVLRLGQIRELFIFDFMRL